MTEVLMPKLSDSMEEGTIISWLKLAGERVEVGDELLEIETDKATVTQAAEVAGILEILADEGATVPAGEVIARIGVSAPASDEVSPKAAESDALVAARPALEALNPIGSSGVVMPANAGSAVRSNGGGRSPATPLARRVAAVHGVALEDVSGTGPLGRITRTDVLHQAGIGPRSPAGQAPSSAPSSAPPSDLATGAVSRQELSHLQRRIARRMSEAKATIPHFQVQTDVVMDLAVALRNELKRVADEGDPVPSFNDMVIKATALALREHPLANGSYKDGAFELHETINIGVAVAADEALVVPTVFDAAGKALGRISQETRLLAARVRSGEITPGELSGGTFTVSNLGMFGMTAITPVINPPQAAILGVGAMRGTLAREEGEIVDRTLLTLTLSCDHRILYGADAARFLARVRELLETPLKLLL